MIENQSGGESSSSNENNLFFVPNWIFSPSVQYFASKVSNKNMLVIEKLC